jgi:NAD(P)-dependent dehydrogenase (short-subunit alcohol dehydrogenase family)
MLDDNAPFAGAGALVIGGGANIGRAVVREFSRRGARVIAADLNVEGARETAELVRAAGGEAHAIACDVADDQSVLDCAAEAARLLGRIDILMNNAGILSGGNPEDIPMTEWHRMMNINFLGMVRAIEAALPDMIARGGGHIVNTASFAGLYPFASSRIHYAAAKAAVVSMSENFALYLMDKGVRVSCLCPGPVMTTSNLSMKHFSENYAMRAPGSQMWVKAQEELATTLADGMRDGRIIIPTHEELWEILVQRAASPDDFIRAKHAEFASGDSGRPQLPEALRPKGGA